MKKVIYPGHPIPLKQPKTDPEHCAHEWIKFKTSDGNILKCKHCGKIITD